MRTPRRGMPKRGAATLTRSYFACESFYNIAKVCKGEILLYLSLIHI